MKPSSDGYFGLFYPELDEFLCFAHDDAVAVFLSAEDATACADWLAVPEELVEIKQFDELPKKCRLVDKKLNEIGG